MKNNWKWLLAGCSLLVLITGLSLTPVSDPDLWIMLATGRYIAESGQIPHTDLWSHTAFGQPWVMHEWLPSVILYGLHKIAGFPGIVILKILLLNLVFFIGIIAARRKGLNPLVVLPVMALAVLASQIGFSERVQIATFLALAAEIFLLDRLERGGISAKAFLIFIAAGFVLWANSHLGLMSGLAVLFIYCLDSAVAGFRQGRWFTFRVMALGFLIACLAVLINPYGISLVKPFFKFYFDPQLIAFDKLIYGTIHEYTSIFSPSIMGDAAVRWGLGWMAFSALGIILNWRNFRLSSLLLWLGFFYLAFYAVRFVPLFVFATLGFTAVNWNQIFSGARHLKIPEKYAGRLSKPVFGAICLAIILAGVLSGFGLAGKRGGGHPLGLDGRLFPVEGTRFVKTNFPDPKILNDFMDGGYLIWNNIPVFIDGRMAPFRYVLEDYISIIKGDTALMNKYDLDLALLRYPRSGKSLSSRLHGYFSGSSQWALVYWDDICLVFARRTDRYKGRIAKYEYKYLNPIFTNPASPPDGFQRELSRAIGQNPGLVTPYLAAFNYYYQRDLALAENYVRQGLAIDGGDASLHNNLGNIYLTKGQNKEAVGEYLKAIALDRNISEAYCNIGYIREMDGNYREAEKYYLKVMEDIDPLNTWAYNRMGMMLINQGRPREAVKYLTKGAAIDQNSEAAWNLRKLRAIY
ncbi:MAG: tetratricopeptide repeat protein [Candidatus Edwardsbacteria bacterium]|nr:tetratricopeptide repeat protein [Candidatus Edwardsbacteria bacterium]MBU1576877.1 tetratricopeptide repeat protein [Candidatus Edwardsbacteria bacterium]MBU2463158.1 tetratricopeptide repeat protein [Candidatus Edwardsbacteria bacterium]MBU2593457.1 tetratricopeptide repeat protein [Candidatus Edwardsbacteria bacterium]